MMEILGFYYVNLGSSFMLSSLSKNQSFPFYWKYHQLRNWWPIWYYLLNNHARLTWQNYKKRSPPDNIEKEVADAVKKEGIAVIPIIKLFPDETFKNLQKISLHLWENPEIKKQIINFETGRVETKDDLIVHLLGGYGRDKPTLRFADPFTKFILDERILRIASEYLGVCPRFRMYSLHSTILVKPDAGALFSQRWHRDPDDKKILKVFLYLNDVSDEGTGPFTYVKRSHLGGCWRDFFPQTPPVGSYPKAGEVESIVPESDIKKCLGRAGTMIFCDTSGLHRGGFSTANRRLMFAGTFITQASVQPKNYILEEGFDISSLSALARHALV